MRFFKIFTTLTVVAILLAAIGCQSIFNFPKPTADADQPVPTPSRALNEKRLPRLIFYSWHKTKAGMIISETATKPLYLSEPEKKPVPFGDYEVEIESFISENSARSHNGKFIVETRRFNERTENSVCCAIQVFDYEVNLVEIANRENSVKLLENASSDWQVQGWTPNDKLILFNSGGELFLINADTRKKTVVLSGRSHIEVKFAKNTPGLFVKSYDKSAYRLEYYDWNTGEITELAAGFRNGSQSSLSPDGTRLAFFTVIWASDAGQVVANRITVFDAETLARIGEHELPPGGVRFGNGGSWKSDGREFAVTLSGEDFASDVYTIQIENGKLTRWYPPTGETTALYK